MISGTKDFQRRVELCKHGRPRRWFRKKAFGMERDGLWGMVYPCEGTGFMYHNGATGWAVSGAVAGRGVLLGWMARRQVAMEVTVVDEDDEE